MTPNHLVKLTCINIIKSVIIKIIKCDLETFKVKLLAVKKVRLFFL